MVLEAVKWAAAESCPGTPETIYAVLMRPEICPQASAAGQFLQGVLEVSTLSGIHPARDAEVEDSQQIVENILDTPMSKVFN